MTPYLFPFFSFTPPVLTSSVQVIGLALVYIGLKVEGEARWLLRTLDKEIDRSHPTCRMDTVAKNIFTSIKGNPITKSIGKYIFFHIPKDFVISYGLALVSHAVFVNKPYMDVIDFFFLSTVIKISIFTCSFCDQLYMTLANHCPNIRGLLYGISRGIQAI